MSISLQKECKNIKKRASDKLSNLSCLSCVYIIRCLNEIEIDKKLKKERIIDELLTKTIRLINDYRSVMRVS